MREIFEKNGDIMYAEKVAAKASVVFLSVLLFSFVNLVLFQILILNQAFTISYISSHFIK